MKKSLLLILLFSLNITSAFSQNEIWKRTTSGEIAAKLKLPRDSNPANFELFSLDLDGLKQILKNAPERNFTGIQSNVITSFPNDQGQLQNFRIYEASVMSRELSNKYPEIKSYVGKGIDDTSAIIRFSVTPFGLHTMTLSGRRGTSYIDPYTSDQKNYIVYSKSELSTSKNFQCGFDDRESELVEDLPVDYFTTFASNSLFKTYRLAMACTIEYAAFHVNAAGLSNGTLAQKKAAVQAAMVVTMTRVNGIYERDFAVTMVFVPNNEDIIFITSDEFDNANTNNILLDQSQSVIDAAIGSANYDIGHTVSTGGGGVAQLQSPCSSSKARGITGLDSPVGDSYDVDYVSHEMGHQFGCQHTFNGDQGSCNGNRTASAAYEPGSGTTIMSYSGICASQNVQNQSDSYFHARSVIQGSSFINGNGNCALAVPNGNTPPVVSAGSNYTIPFGTAFVLKGTASDVDGDALTYCWEQYDNQISIQPPVPSSTNGPNFRSVTPSVSPDRYFPKLSDVLANNLTPTWEVIPNVARNMNFSLVVRDNGTPNGGQTERSTMALTYANAGPFKVTSQSSNSIAWLSNSQQTVTWDVAGTDANGINTNAVNIKLSVDGGLTFAYTLVANTANDGSETFTVPNIPASLTCRIMVEAVGNIYYAVNTQPFYIGYEIVNNCQTYEFTTAFALPDGASGYTVKPITVTETATITDVNIHVNATHPNIQNLIIAVIRPGGALTQLFNQQCAGNADLDVTFDAQGTAFTCGSPTTGTYIPPTNANLNSFNGFNPVGNWQFGFRDAVTGDSGTIDSFSLELCSQTVNLATENFNFSQFALYPNPGNGNFTIQFDSSSNAKIGIAVHDLRGRKIFDKSFANTGMFKQNIGLENTQSGVYLVSVTDGDKKIVKRIVVE